MNNIKEIVGKEIGTVSISMYKDIESGHKFFRINTDNENVLQLSYIIEDFLYNL